VHLILGDEGPGCSSKFEVAKTRPERAAPPESGERKGSGGTPFALALIPSYAWRGENQHVSNRLSVGWCRLLTPERLRRIVTTADADDKHLKLYDPEGRVGVGVYD